MVEALKDAYPEPASRPDHVKVMIDKHDQKKNKSSIKSLHQATSALDRAQRQLSETADAKRAHRATWVAHLTESLKVWESSLEDYRKHQASLQDMTLKARADIALARQAIERLNAQAGTPGPKLSKPTSVEEEKNTEDQADLEEERLRTQLQGVLQACAGSLGVALQRPPEDVQVVPSDEEKVVSNQRAQSLMALRERWQCADASERERPA